MIGWLRRLADGPDAPLCDQMRALWRQQSTPRVLYDRPAASVQMDNPRLKPRTYAEWERRHGQRRTA